MTSSKGLLSCKKRQSPCCESHGGGGSSSISISFINISRGIRPQVAAEIKKKRKKITLIANINYTGPQIHR